MLPLISVVIPTRNRAALLGEALDSVAEQRGIGLSSIEVIVVNDGGEPVDDRVCAARHRGLCVGVIDLSQRHGLPVARNAGIEEARGTYLTFLDDDDVYLPMHLETVLNEMDSGADLVFADCLVSGRHVDPSRPVGTTDAFDFPFDAGLLRVANTIPVHCALMRNVRAAATRFDGSLGALEDWDFWLRLHESGYRFRHVPTATVVYHRIADQRSMTGSTSDEAAGLAHFGHLVRLLWGRWPATEDKVTRFRSWVGIMYWHAHDAFARGERPAHNFYLRSIHLIAAAWAGSLPEDGLVELLAEAVTEESTDDVAVA